MRRILLAVSGLNPQIITEALYCLHSEGRMVDAIHCVTTRRGRDLLLSALLDGGRGRFFRFCAEYGIEAARVDFPPDHIHIPQDAHGSPLDDILDQDDNEALLRLCLRLAAELTAEADTALFFLVAGGRKTMSSCLAFAAQMYGRPQDRVYHVLVSPEFEGHPDFWYPPKTSRLLTLRDNQGQPFYKETRYASLRLIALPFVPLRERLPAEFLAAAASPTPGALLAALVREEERRFVISPRAGVVAYGSVELDMHPAPLALLTLFCERRLACDEPAAPDACPPWFLAPHEVFGAQGRLTALYESIRGGRTAAATSDTGIVNLNKANFFSYKSRINAALVRAFGRAGEELGIRSWGRRPNTRFGIGIDKRRVELR